MTAFVSQGELSREALTDAPDGAWIDTFLDSYNDFRRNTTIVLQRGISTENTVNGEKTLTLVHNVEVACSSPLRVPIKGIIPVRCDGIVLNSDGSLTSSVYQLDMPTISWRPNPLSTDGGVLVKATYPAPFGEIELRKTANQSIANNSATAVTWDLQKQYTSTQNLTHRTTTNNTRINCLANGFVQVSYELPWSALAVVIGNRICGFVSKNSSIASVGSRWGNQRQQGSGGSADSVSTSPVVPVVSGDYIEVYALQINSTLSAMSVLGNGVAESAVQAKYVAPALNTTGRVNLLFYGG